MIDGAAVGAGLGDCMSYTSAQRSTMMGWMRMGMARVGGTVKPNQPTAQPSRARASFHFQPLSGSYYTARHMH